MMTKDKKPFTYTPGGIDLSEIRSPRMARRIERNANAPGVGENPNVQGNQPKQPLPPSALAAMQPQLPVQVFPSGAPPVKNAPPPPPPPPANAPPPPPLPDLPFKPAYDGTVRPDMTKIIPENPMALLKKSPGVQRKNYVDPVFQPPSRPMPQSPPQQMSQPLYNQAPVQAQAPAPAPPQPMNQGYSQPAQSQYNQGPQSPKTPQSTPSPHYQQPEPQFVRPQSQRVPQTPPQQERTPSPPTKTSTVQLGQLYIPPINNNNNNNNSVNTTPKQSPGSPNVNLQKAPTPNWMAKNPQQQQQQQMPPWVRESQPASSPPVQNQQQQYNQPQFNQSENRNVGPQPQRRPEVNRSESTNSRPTSAYNPQYNQSPNVQYSPNVIRVAPPSFDDEAPNAFLDGPPPTLKDREVVWVTQPQVFVHPGPRPAGPQQNRPPQQQQQGPRVIPVQFEGRTPGTPSTPGSERSLNRQQSWSTPTQSNSFRVIQKITNTDGDDDEDEPAIEQTPRQAQQMPVDQMRKMNLNQADRDLMNKFRQEVNCVCDEENPRYRGGHIPSKIFRILDESGIDMDIFLHNEPDPRYRGPEIPSKAFRLLQNMTDGTPFATFASVPQGQPQPQASKGPQVRTIPIQIEGDDNPQPYVHPSQQTVPEPKKYTGSAIPSRSFKILQAMTSPENYAAPCENNEKQPSDPSYDQWQQYPYPPYPPFWQNYWGYRSDKTDTETDDTDCESSRKNPRSTPLPFYYPMYPPNYYPPFMPPPPDYSNRLKNSPEKSNSDTEIKKRTPRSCSTTPVPKCNSESEMKRQARASSVTPVPKCNSESEVKRRSRSCNTTPVPKINSDNDIRRNIGNPRSYCNTPVNFWECYPPYPPPVFPHQPNEANSSDQNGNNQYPPMWDPYGYYPYYYPYPPMYPPPPMGYPPQPSESGELTGYSSTDEMAHYVPRYAPNFSRSNCNTPTPQVLQESGRKSELKRTSSLAESNRSNCNTPTPQVLQESGRKSEMKQKINAQEENVEEENAEIPCEVPQEEEPKPKKKIKKKIIKKIKRRHSVQEEGSTKLLSDERRNSVQEWLGWEEGRRNSLQEDEAPKISVKDHIKAFQNIISNDNVKDNVKTNKPKVNKLRQSLINATLTTSNEELNAQREELRSVEIQREAIRAEEMRREKIRQEDLRREALRQEALKQEALRQEAIRQEQLRQEALRQEAIKQEAIRQENLRQEAIRQEKLRQEAIRQEALRQEALRQEALKQEALRQEALRKEALRQEELKKEALRKEAERQEEMRRKQLEQEQFDMRRANAKEDLRQEDDYDELSDSDSSDSQEEEEDQEVRRSFSSSAHKLHAIRSVSDINVYKESDSEQEYEVEEATEHEDDSDDDDESQEEEEEEVYCEENEMLPHQLSVIFEESERADSIVTDRQRQTSFSTMMSDDTMTIDIQVDDVEDSESEFNPSDDDNLLNAHANKIFGNDFVLNVRSPAKSPFFNSSVSKFFSEFVPAGDEFPEFNKANKAKVEEKSKKIIGEKCKIVFNKIEPPTMTFVEEISVKVQNAQKFMHIAAILPEEQTIEVNEENWWDVIKSDSTNKFPTTYATSKIESDNEETGTETNDETDTEISENNNKEANDEEQQGFYIKVIRKSATETTTYADTTTDYDNTETIDNDTLEVEKKVVNEEYVCDTADEVETIDGDESHDDLSLGDDSTATLEENIEDEDKCENLEKDNVGHTVEENDDEQGGKEEEEEEEIDFWKEIAPKDDIPAKKPKTRYRRYTEEMEEETQSSTNYCENNLNERVEVSDDKPKGEKQSIDMSSMKIPDLLEINIEDISDQYIIKNAKISSVESMDILYEKPPEMHVLTIDDISVKYESCQQAIISYVAEETCEEVEEETYEEVEEESKSTEIGQESYQEIKEKVYEKKLYGTIEKDDDNNDEENESDEEDDSGDENDNDEQTNNVEEEEAEPELSVKDQIKAFQERISNKETEVEVKTNVKELISCIETGVTKKSSISSKNSGKSFEECSEDDVDSGVTDISRNISEGEPECEFPELRKMSRYQRAATHSRLFKLLQEEEEEEEEEAEKEKEELPIIIPKKKVHNVSITRRNAALKAAEEKKRLEEEQKKIEEMQSRRGLLSLPLKNSSEPESFASSGINSPASPIVNERLVNELVQSLLRRKKGHVFRNMPMEKLQAAAIRILQEDAEVEMSSSEDCNSFPSPLRNGTENSTPAITPQEFLNEYNQYYETWGNSEDLGGEDDYDIMPSKAFRLLQENALKPGSILAKCPRVLSSKNVYKELKSVIESNESDLSSPDPDPVSVRTVPEAS